MNELTHLDLFSGIGGFSLAFQRAGFRTIGFCEIEPYAQRVLEKNFGAVMAQSKCKRLEKSGAQHPSLSMRPSTTSTSEELEEGSIHAPRIYPDITKLDGSIFRGVTIITGGFPCQPFSVAGKRRGSADDRALWPEMRRVIEQARPAWVLGENVSGIVNMELDRVLSDLETLGYATRTFIVPACALDARHRRDRVWIIAYAASCGFDGRNNQRGGSNNSDQERNAKEDEPPKDRWLGGLSKIREADKYAADPLSGRLACGPDKSSEAQPGSAASIGTRPAFHRENGAVWLPEPELGRVAHGIPNRVHRLKGLGNAIVPQVAEVFARFIAEIERNAQ